VDRSAVAGLLEEIASLLALKGENPFKVRAFENAARALSSLEDFDGRMARGEIGKVKGIGASIAEVIREASTTGRSTVRDELRASFPPGIFDLLKVPGLGPKRASALYAALGIGSLAELGYAIAENRLSVLSGFGPKVQEKLAEGLRFVASTAGRLRLPEARAASDAAAAALARAGIEVEVAGELRRRSEVVSSLVFASPSAPELAAGAAALPRDRGDLPVSIVSRGPAGFGTALVLATGSDAHLEALRSTAPGLLERDFATEEALYAAAGLAFVPPELREGRGEIERARAGTLPRLVGDGDLRGIFHVHSTFSDGKASLPEIFRRCVDLGYSYVGITDHSPAAAYAGGLTPGKVLAQWAEIEALRPSFPSLAVFRGTEADILADGSIDYGDDFLSGFDFVVASVHSAFHLPREAQTARLVRAARNPRVTMLGHATGRLLLGRAGIDVDMPAVLAAAGEAGCGVEVNASPWRLDLDWRLGEAARSAGVFTSVNPDAHDLGGLEDASWGVGIARKGGFSAGEVLNCGEAGDVAERLLALRRRKG
jgi:DNA polymerase (family 10)